MENEVFGTIFKMKKEKVVKPDEEELCSFSLLLNPLIIHDGVLERRLEDHDVRYACKLFFIYITPYR